MNRVVRVYVELINTALRYLLFLAVGEAVEKRFFLISVDYYTGLRDVDQKDVYENDIFEKEGDYGVVKYNSHQAHFEIIFNSGKIFKLVEDKKGKWKVSENKIIGNIHLNPNLIKRENND